MAETKIEWAEKVWNPLRGCTRVSEGCRNCYAERMSARGLPGLNSPATGEPFAIMTPSGPRWTGKVELIESQLDVPLHWKRPKRIFVNSMSDTFHEAVEYDWIKRIFSVMERCSQHTFQVLTKRGDSMRLCMMGWCRGRSPLPNVWLGISASTRHDLAAQIMHLRATPAAIRFLSLEPLVEDLGVIDLSGIGWVIVGGESGPGARPMHPDWVRSIRDQCVSAKVPFFFKQWGAWGGDEAWEEYCSSRHPHTYDHARGQRVAVWPDPPYSNGLRGSGEVARYRVGKKAAGRLLDGREWNEFPEVTR